MMLFQTKRYLPTENLHPVMKNAADIASTASEYIKIFKRTKIMNQPYVLPKLTLNTNLNNFIPICCFYKQEQCIPPDT